jgi:glycerol-3-phosphate acyltransferase PlsY
MLAYLVGSIPFGLIFTRFLTVRDIRRVGSGNIGTTNVLRTAGPLPGILTLAGDTIKGALPAWLAQILCGAEGFWPDVFLSVVLLAAFLGHLYPLYLKFKGGKGVATTVGCFLVATPAALLFVLPFFAGALIFFRRMSVASLSAAFLLPVFVFATKGSPVLTGCALLFMVFILLRHQDNLKRLACGIEPVLWGKEQ